MADESICSVDGCGKAARKRGYCNGHYLKVLRYGDPLVSPGRKPPPNRLVEMVGQKFGCLTVVSREPRARGQAYWRCVCDCGGEKVTAGQSLRIGATTSCGCLRPDRSRKNATRHGHAATGKETPEYKAWNSAIQRCTNPNNKSFPHYGGNGIKVCKRWRQSFEAFLADMGPRPSSNHSLDRYPDRRGHYEPGNVRWATQDQQSENRDFARGANHGAAKLSVEDVLAIRSSPLNSVQLAGRYGVSPSAIQRIRNGTSWVGKAV